VERWERGRIEPARYNPRVQDRSARKKLRESLERGLVEPLVVNRRNGVLVSGHQRLSILDEDAKGEPYSLDVSVVDLDDAAERALNVAMNNPALMGSYDFGGLEKLMAEGLDAKAAGFDALDLAALFPEQGFGVLLDPEKDAAKGTVEELKEYKKKAKERGKGEDNAEFWVTFVASDEAEVRRFLAAAGLDPGERFHDVRKLADFCGVSLDPPAG